MTLAWIPRLDAGKRRIAGLLLGLALLVPFVKGASPAPAASPEYQLKAVFLFNFAQFVEWPSQGEPDRKTPFVIGILGDDPFGSYLDDLVRNEKVGDRPLVVRRYQRPGDISSCQIVFICRSELRSLNAILADVKEHSVLTVSDLDGFTRQGGMVRFAMENGKIRLRINVEAAKAGNLKISSKILRPGTVVAPGKD